MGIPQDSRNKTYGTKNAPDGEKNDKGFLLRLETRSYDQSGACFIFVCLGGSFNNPFETSPANAKDGGYILITAAHIDGKSHRASCLNTHICHHAE